MCWVSRLSHLAPTNGRGPLGSHKWGAFNYTAHCDTCKYMGRDMRLMRHSKVVPLPWSLGIFSYLIVLYLPLCWMWINMAKSRQYRVSYRGQIEAWKPWSQVGTWAGDSDWNHHPRTIVPSWHSVTDPTRWILCKHLLVQPLLLFYSIRSSTCLVSAASATVGIGWPTSKVFL